ncbi:MAG: hypothetical protein H6738_16960 [Alphaproteobacteria bacterium]|nr:hypothetical protein [Alphaproteobacteria bacterium]MCB9698474.1 hypothetical protein [Alphaproteobacteria bacterium]
MSYFDHVRCNSCKAMLDPESLGGRPGEGLTCPRCGAPLALTDLFGLKDSFAEEDEQEMSFEDLVSVQAGPAARGPSGPSAPPPSPPPRPGQARPSRPAPGPSRAAPPARAGGAPARAGTAMVRHGSANDDDSSEEAAPPRALPGPSSAPAPQAPAKKGSALEAMRKLKGR